MDWATEGHFEPSTDPDHTHPRIAQFVRTSTLRTIERHGVYPEAFLKLHLESAQVYQDFSGRLLGKMVREGQIQTISQGQGNEKHTYIAPAGQTPSENAIRTCMQETLAVANPFFEQSRCGNYSELLNYIALCRVVLDLWKAGLKEIDILPPGNYPDLLRHNGQVDALLVMRSEYFPVDVYNGFTFLMTNDKKPANWRRFRENAGTRGNPVLVSRLSSRTVKEEFIKGNGLVLDHGASVLLGGKEDKELRRLLKKFAIADRVILHPPMTVLDKPLDGDEFYKALSEERKLPGKFTTEAFAEAASQLPSGHLERTRGLVHLLFVNQEWRRATNTEGRIVAHVLERAMAKMLRTEERHLPSTLLSESWNQVVEEIPWAKMHYLNSREKILNEATRRLDELAQVGIVYQYGGYYRARGAKHPMQSLQFSGS